eukprot:1157906-Pelagomonas_calceolata.AAC.9
MGVNGHWYEVAIRLLHYIVGYSSVWHLPLAHHASSRVSVSQDSTPPSPFSQELHLSGIPLTSQGLISLVLGGSQHMASVREGGLQSSKPIHSTVRAGAIELGKGEEQQNTSAATTATSDNQPPEKGGQSASLFDSNTEVTAPSVVSSSGLRPGSEARSRGSVVADSSETESMGSEGVAAERKEVDCVLTAGGGVPGVTAKLGALTLSMPAASQAHENTDHGAAGMHHSLNILSAVWPRDGGDAHRAATATAAPLGPAPPSPPCGAPVAAPLHSLQMDPWGGGLATTAALRGGLCQLSALTRLEVGPMLPAPIDHPATTDHPTSLNHPASLDLHAPLHHPAPPQHPACLDYPPASCAPPVCPAAENEHAGTPNMACAAGAMSDDTAVGADTIL